MSGDIAYGIIRRAVADSSFLEKLSEDPDVLISREGITDPKERSELKDLLYIIAGAQQNSTLSRFIASQLKSTSETADAFKTGLRKTVEQIDTGFRWTMIMYMVAFYLGVGMIVFSIAFAIIMEKTLLPLVFGGLGVADVIGFFIAKPPQHLQSKRANLAQLQAVYFNWFVDVYNWNSYLCTLGQSNSLDYEKVKQISATLLENTDRTMSLVEKYCKFNGKQQVYEEESVLDDT